MLKMILAAASLGLLAAAPAPLYEKAGSIPGPDGGWDFASLDPVHHRLFIAHGDAVMVVDLAHGNAVQSFGIISHGHAVVHVPGTELLAVTSGKDSTVRLFDVPSGEQRASIAVGDDPDAAIIDPATGHLLTMNAHGGTVSEVDLGRAKVVRTMTLKPGLEFPVIGPRHVLYVANEDEDAVETIDLATGKPGATIALTGCEGPTGLAYDRQHNRLIAACANEVVKVVDLSTRKVTQTLPIGTGPDAVLVDMARSRALIPCGGSGTLEVLDLGGASVRKLATVTSEPGARTGAIDPVAGVLYLPTARFGPPPADGKRAPSLAGSFHVVMLKRT